MLKNKWGVNKKGRDAVQSFHAKGKEIIDVELSREAPPKQKKCNSNNNPEFKFSQKQYSFKDEQVVTMFHLLNKDNKLKLLEIRLPDKVGCTNNPNYYLFHRMAHHPIVGPKAFHSSFDDD